LQSSERFRVAPRSFVSRCKSTYDVGPAFPPFPAISRRSYALVDDQAKPLPLSVRTADGAK
jgi:hypothetical protein